MMSQVKINSSKDQSLCLCEMCKCGSHICIPVIEQNPFKIGQLPMVKDVDGRNICCNDDKYGNRVCDYDQPPAINLYSKSTYKQDFSTKSNIIGAASDAAKLAGSLKCEGGPMQSKSSYHRDFIPYSVEEVKLFNRKEDDIMGNEQFKEEEFDIMKDLKPEVVQRLRDYYCPLHCPGKVKEHKINCISTYKDKCYLDPPLRKAIPHVKEASVPFSKFTNYSLDYVTHKIKPRENLSQLQPQIGTQIEFSYPRSFNTTHKSDYICWSWDNYTKKGLRPPVTKFNMGVERPLALHSSNAVDYREHNVVAQSKPVKRQDELIVPNCRMETETTSGLAFQKWDNAPVQKIVKSCQEGNHITSSNETCFVTNYQQDFDNLKKVFCPAKLIEKYGRKILEPKFHFVGCENEHDFYHKIHFA